MIDLEELIADATRLAKSAPGAGLSPRFAKRDYDDAMLALAGREAREGETLGAALCRLHGARDERLAKLSVASYQAELHERRGASERVARQARDLLVKHLGYDPDAPPSRPRHGSKAHVLKLMTDLATHRKRDDETVEQAFDRLLRDDVTFRDCYGAYCDAPA
jgi:hypothetical protein